MNICMCWSLVGVVTNAAYAPGRQLLRRMTLGPDCPRTSAGRGTMLYMLYVLRTVLLTVTTNAPSLSIHPSLQQGQRGHIHLNAAVVFTSAYYRAGGFTSPLEPAGGRCQGHFGETTNSIAKGRSHGEGARLPPVAALESRPRFLQGTQVQTSRGHSKSSKRGCDKTDPGPNTSTSNSTMQAYGKGVVKTAPLHYPNHCAYHVSCCDFCR